MKRLFAMILTLAMAAGLLTAAAVPASAAAVQCDRCGGTGLYECFECAGFGYYYRCPDHPGRTAFDPGQVCDDCDEPLPLTNPCDGGCVDDGAGFYVTACSECNGTGATRPDPPKNLSFIPGDGTITMTWEAPDNDGGSPIIGYKIQRGIEGYHDDVVKVDLSPDVFSYTWDGLKNGTLYTFYVWAVNDVDQSWPTTGEDAPEGPREPSNTFKLWGKQTGWGKTPLAWFLLIVCFGWIWMAF